MARPRALQQVVDQAFLAKIFQLCLLRVEDEEIVKHFGIGKTTWNKWLRTEPSIAETVKRGRTEADAQVANALYLRAIGYTHPETETQWNHKSERWETLEIMRHYPPDPTAGIFFLINRQRGRWFDVRSPQLSLNLAVKGVDEQALAIARALMSQADQDQAAQPKRVKDAAPAAQVEATAEGAGQSESVSNDGTVGASGEEKAT